jgi:uncharacterized protein YgiM (DUF1202 family)
MSKLKVLCLAALLVAGVALVAVWAAPKLVSVQVKEGHVRSGPSFLSEVIAKVAYGDRVELLGEEGAWSKVRLTGKSGQGWMHSSALTTKKIVLKAGAQDAKQAASSNEVALAGKGFNADVEREFKAKHKEVDFAWIDHMEKIVVSSAKMQEFVQAGALSPEGGAK